MRRDPRAPSVTLFGSVGGNNFALLPRGSPDRTVVPEMAGDAKSRLRWHLKAERAFGLKTLPIHASAETPQDDLPASQCADETDRPAAPPPVAPVVRQTVGQTQKKADALFAPDPDAPGFDAPALSPDDKRRRLIALDENEVRGCTKCRLCEKRTNTVFGEGDPDAKIFFIGEGPGENEDLQGRPFVGRAGELLNKWIAAMGLRREQVFIANIVKCRPPGNREPAPDETATCTPYLQRQIEIVRPHVIITLGRPSAQYMLQSKLSMGKLRGQWHAWRGIKLMPTYHPAYVLRQYTVETRRAVWDDLQTVMKELNLPLPKARQGEG
jgi:DNA polymerase